MLGNWYKFPNGRCTQVVESPMRGPMHSRYPRVTMNARYSKNPCHYNDVIMSAISSQITSLTIVYSTVYSAADQRKHQRSASLAIVRGIHRGPVNSPHKWSVTRKCFHLMTSSCGIIVRPGCGIYRLMFTPSSSTPLTLTWYAIPLLKNNFHIFIFLWTKCIAFKVANIFWDQCRWCW